VISIAEATADQKQELSYLLQLGRNNSGGHRQAGVWQLLAIPRNYLKSLCFQEGPNYPELVDLFDHRVGAACAGRDRCRHIDHR
jgi:hypothetical protein